MKLNRFFMLGLAGLAFVACSNEEEGMGSKFPAGNGAVSIKIVSPTITKAIGTGNSADVPVVPAAGSEVVITLTDNSTENPTQTITLSAENWGTGKVVTFWNVTDPQKVEVSMNDGKATYTAQDVITGGGLQEVENIPAYGATTTFVPEDRTDSPDMANDNQGGAGVETGADAEDVDKTYQIYTATVNMSIPVARLEVSGIKHITTGHVTDACAYETLTIGGVYLDNVISNGNGVKYENGAFTNATGTPGDYRFVDNDVETGTGDPAILFDPADDETFGGTDFLKPDGVWPTEGNAFGYNFFGVSNDLPKFKIYFSASVSSDADHPLPAPRYAMITKYWQDNAKSVPLTEFKPGTIYRITSATLTDENIIGDEGGNTLYGVEVTVKEATWAVQTIYADWAD